MCAELVPRCTVDWDLKRLLSGICFHSGRTDIDFGHHDYRNSSGLGVYHWHHSEGPHLHPHEGMQAEIWVDGYPVGKKYDAYLDNNENRVYTKDFSSILRHFGLSTGIVDEASLEIFKPGISSLDYLTIPLKNGHAKLVDLLDVSENICGYYVYNTRTIKGVFIVELKVDKLVAWLHGEKFEGYIKSNTKYLMLQNLEKFIYYLGSHYVNGIEQHDYDSVIINDGKLHIIGKVSKTITLPKYHQLDINKLLKDCNVANPQFHYVVSSEWYWKSKKAYYIALTRAYFQSMAPTIPSKTKYSDFGVQLNVKPPTDGETEVNVWFNGEKIPNGFIHRDGQTLIRFIPGANHPYGAYLMDFSTVEDAIIAHEDEEYTSYWYDKRENTYNIVINSQMRNAPIMMVRRGNQIMIFANFKFTGSLGNELFESRNETYGEVAIEGIKKCCEGRYFEQCLSGTAQYYDVFGSDYVDVHVNINNNSLTKSLTKSLDFHINDEGRGFCAYNIDWDISGNILNGLYCYAFQDGLYYGYEHFSKLAAHEFGHLIGLGDAYEDMPKQHAALVTKETPRYCIMRDNSMDITSNDIEMVLEAFKTNALQIYDPMTILGTLYNPFMSKVIRLGKDDVYHEH